MLDKSSPQPVEKSPAKFSVVLGFMNASMFMFTLNNVFGKEVMNREVGYATFTEFTLVRMIFMSLASYGYLLKLNIKVTDVPQNLRLILFARCFIGSVNFVILAIAIKVISLSI